MGQPSTSAQIRAVALKEAVATSAVSFPKDQTLTRSGRRQLDDEILARTERFASYIEHGEEVDANA